jgi:hypothetical protein
MAKDNNGDYADRLCGQLDTIVECEPTFIFK